VRGRPEQQPAGFENSAGGFKGKKKESQPQQASRTRQQQQDSNQRQADNAVQGVRVESTSHA